MTPYDAIIIGSGQAGTPLAFKLAGEGQKVAFIEKQHLGGTCLNVGCTPTKAYVASARRRWDALHGEELGIVIPAGATANLARVKARKDALIQKSVDGITAAVEKNQNIDFYKGAAHFVNNFTLSVNGQELQGQKIFINVGGRPLIPEGFEEVDVLTNESILELEELPEHLIVVGGSYVGLEFAQIFKRLGSRVTLIDRNARLIKREDEFVSEAVRAMLEEEGIELRLNADCLRGENLPKGGVSVTLYCNEGDPTVKGSHLLLATGRQMNTDRLKLENTDIEVSGRGHIPVNKNLETNVKGIFALGDCNGEGGFTHTAYNDFEIIANNLVEGGQRSLQDRIRNYGLFVDPPLARCGLTANEARSKGHELLYGYRPMSKVARAKEKGETTGFIFIVIDAKTEKILGATIFGVGGDEAIGSILNLMYAGASYKVLRDSVQPHPTVIELLPTVLQSLSTKLEIN